ncbi:hypothetical protein D1AOALGA4SA_13001 [Olavius algarvensis Delta 1 endosymbiont]|nr:hypothetical protein D1AOALGA4SA_13001 [Olavius algarvensis Delta 1 endosymbiont]
MESAKKNIQIFDFDSDPVNENASNHLAAIDGHKTRSKIVETAADPSPKPSLEKKPEIGQRLSKDQLINKLNFINFQDGSVLINFTHSKYDKKLTLQAAPQPCTGDFVECLWLDADYTNQITRFYEFSNLLIANGHKLLKVAADLVEVDEKGIRLLLPEACYEISARKVKRRRCEGIEVLLMQNSTVFKGSLMDFNGFSFRVKLDAVPPPRHLIG